MMGKNLRGQTEPLTRRWVAQSSGAMVALFAKGSLEIEKFSDSLSALANRTAPILASRFRGAHNFSPARLEVLIWPRPNNLQSQSIISLERSPESRRRWGTPR